MFPHIQLKTLSDCKFWWRDSWILTIVPACSCVWMLIWIQMLAFGKSGAMFSMRLNILLCNCIVLDPSWSFHLISPPCCFPYTLFTSLPLRPAAFTEAASSSFMSTVNNVLTLYVGIRTPELQLCVANMWNAWKWVCHLHFHFINVSSLSPQQCHNLFLKIDISWNQFTQ